MAQAETIPTTRRAFSKWLAGVGVAAAAPSPLRASLLPPDDAELVSLANEITLLQQQWESAKRFSAARRADYERLRPKKPEVLLWRVTDPVTYSRDEMHVVDGK